LVEKNLSLIEQPITVFKIGRAEDNNIRIQNNTVSRK
jgi:pSer/pThr/pTyr-binding forkhead associated (FHA) protein